MALKSELGFGMMRLPTLSSDPTDFDFPQLCEMVDTFLTAGYTYFDTSFVYHNGKSDTPGTASGWPPSTPPST